MHLIIELLDSLRRPPLPRTRWQKFKDWLDELWFLVVFMSPDVVAGLMIGVLLMWLFR